VLAAFDGKKYIDAVDRAFESLSDDFAARLSGRDCRACAAHPAAAGQPGWSMGDVIEHLVLSYRGTAAQCEKYRERGAPTTKKAAWNQLAARTLVIGLGRFPRGVSAPEFVMPGRGNMAPMDGNALAGLFRDELARLDNVLAACEQAFGKQPLAPHFRFGPLTARQWRKFHVVHGRHHLAQLARIEKSIAAGALPQ
jgi:hypothetical protein